MHRKRRASIRTGWVWRRGSEDLSAPCHQRARDAREPGCAGRGLCGVCAVTPEVLVVGGGMITHDQILPSLYHLQRLGVIGEISVCATRRKTIRGLKTAQIFEQAFPGQTFRG